MGYMCIKGNNECDGCMECRSNPKYYCPVCGEEVLEAVFVANDGDVLGCDNCAQIKDPFDMVADETDE